MAVNATLIRCRVLRPVVLWGRVAGCGERLNLPADLFDELHASGYVERVDQPAEVNGDNRTQPLTH